MSKAHFLKDITSQLCDVLPQALKKDFTKSCRGILNQAFTRFNLITREEFDVQSKVLARTRKKLEEVEKHIKELENLLHSKHHK